MVVSKDESCPTGSEATCGTYSLPDERYTVNSTANAAPSFWKTLQGFISSLSFYRLPWETPMITGHLTRASRSRCMMHCMGKGNRVDGIKECYKICSDKDSYCASNVEAMSSLYSMVSPTGMNMIFESSLLVWYPLPFSRLLCTEL